MAEETKDQGMQALERDLEPSGETAEGVIGGRTATDPPRAKRRAKKRAARTQDATAPTTPNLTTATTNKLTAK